MKTILNFKNRKVRTKILLSFAATIGIMCFGFIFIILASFKILESVNIINEDITFQNELSVMLENYQMADIDANVLYQILDKETNEEFSKHASSTEQEFQVVFAHIDSYAEFEKFRPEIESAYTQFSAWKKAVEEMIARNNDLDKGRENFASIADKLSESLTAFMDYQIAGNVPQDQLSLANQINNLVTDFRISSLLFQHTFDTSSADQSLKGMVEAISLLEEYQT